ncbi:flagellar biosynthesis repressor FlbT [Aurantimonas sp. C2-6-R+9]|uniref:flagellar biosynthesis repressor FlbT n=1 Tax=unclassified Aurantimonas TaxID=2638230 RepID=UPI002E170A2E|nr:MULTISPECIES: flagellar biosynthesis repressor FlbT [unclassified Aurantimonas]MEC5291008.1 flagellar biosynthesis repressor FlbT [Aurantimonas sp. C2-3-R2]MEC5323439.1 flagellar biosynthesis repressor FlbT [Aurantimonas sp. A3-2-R12]MEC5381337.1 flagellar biosynthesis repressor FlbT [Aurantimonas sp. C2-6-R+9]MEC5412159.1 flagellar biosynthesis repressor FlbT [Aurantimonas sp. C2-4-R8]
MATLRITLRAGERIFVNGAVLKVDRKTTLEFLNDVTFLLESHVMQAEQATTPLRQLYFIVQMMLMDPNSAAAARQLFGKTLESMLGTYQNSDIVDGLAEIEGLIERERAFEALKRLRTLIPIEDDILRVITASPGPARTKTPELRLAAGGF